MLKTIESSNLLQQSLPYWLNYKNSKVACLSLKQFNVKWLTCEFS